MSDATSSLPFSPRQSGGSAAPQLLTAREGGSQASPPGAPVTAKEGGSALPTPGELVLVVGGQRVFGWEGIRVTRGVERMPSDFELGLSERYPGQVAAVTVQPGQACTVMLGNQLVVTGYVDRVAPALGPDRHTIQVQGRGKCQDLVDCSVTEMEVPGLQISGGTVVSLAKVMATPFKISVSLASGSPPQLPQVNVNMGEAPYDVLERVARYSQLLLYEDANGNLVLSQVGTTAAASGFVEGVNVQEATATFAIDQRFSVYVPSLMAVDKLVNMGGADDHFTRVYDTTVPRYRPRVIISEQFFAGGASLAEARAKWELARRFGRSQTVRLVCDSWTDTAGTAWTPNTIAPVNLPTLKIINQKWVINEVSYLRDSERGTTAEVILMPMEAFQPEPEILQAINWQVLKDQAPSPAAPGTSKQ